MRSVSVALGVLETVAREQPVGVSEVARAMSVPKSTAQRMLRTLGALGWIRCDDTAGTRWWLTAKAMSIGMAHRADDELRRIAWSAMLSVATATGETVHLSVLDGRDVVLIEKIDSIHAVRTFTSVGGRAPLHTVASGKAILAAMTEEHATALLTARPLERLSSSTEVDVDVLGRELVEVRRLGYAVTIGTRHPEVAAVGAAILGSNAPVGALSISMPIHRLTDARVADLGVLITDAAADCTDRLLT